MKKLLFILTVLLLTTSCKGTDETNGRDGVDGKNGTDGARGADGTAITVVQFCPGTTSYPSAFLEIGLVISGKLYGVYSANNGFLTELPPGYYNSNAVGSNCNFTVNADLSISN